MPSSRRRSSASSTDSATLDALLNDPSTDTTLATLQAARLRELADEASKTSQPLSGPVSAASIPTGHGTPAHLSEAQAISATAEPGASLLLFTHADMAACAAMERAVAGLAARRPGVRCVVVRAEQAEWLAARLRVRVLPALLGFVDGRETGRLVGFEGVAGGAAGGAKAVERVAGAWRLWRAGSGSEDEGGSEGEDEGRRDGRAAMGRRKVIRDGGVGGRGAEDDDDDDWD